MSRKCTFINSIEDSTENLHEWFSDPKKNYYYKT
jgi:hypothetical protein